MGCLLRALARLGAWRLLANRASRGMSEVACNRMSATYDEDFYRGQREGSGASAAAVLPIVFGLLGAPSSILDVGCGVGTWIAAAAELGVSDAVGVDGDYVDQSKLLISAERFRARDLVEPLRLERKFDLVMSMEVAEHLEPQHADGFIDSLTRHGDTVLFSAAVPGQGGAHHVNEQWPSYWLPKFAERGFVCFDVLRPAIWDDARIESWYRQNLLIFARETPGRRIAAAITRLGFAAMPILDVVHPELFALARQPSSESWRSKVRSVRRRLQG